MSKVTPVAVQGEQVAALPTHSLADEEGLLPSQRSMARKACGVELHELHARQAGISTSSHGLPVPSGHCWVCGGWVHLQAQAGSGICAGWVRYVAQMHMQ